MAYYDKIARKWHRVTGHRGGAFKASVLNDLLLERVPSIAGCSILDLEAGNGYFLPLLLRRFSGQVPSRVVVSDISPALLEIAQHSFRIEHAEYRILDIRKPFPFENKTFDLVLSTMVFNEIPDAPLSRAISECRRVLSNKGLLLVVVQHPAFIASLAKRGLLRRRPDGKLSMPAAGGLRLPVVRRRLHQYARLLSGAGLQFTAQDIFPTQEVLRAKPRLRQTGGVPLACMFVAARDDKDG